jgi:1-acyl-sn-glycerol-3-phosphate acyltransferase
MAHLRRTQVEARIGKPFYLPVTSTRAKGDELAACTHLIMVHIASLLPQRYWGYYSESPALKALQEGEDPWPYCALAEGVVITQPET